MADNFAFDPFDPKFFEDPYPAYTTMRHEHPVYKKEVENHRVWPHYWMLSRAADVNSALSDWKTYSSAGGTLVDTDVSLLPPNMFHMDPPHHDELRSILSRVLTPKRIADLEPQIYKYALSLIEERLAAGTFDASTDFAQLIPTVTMCTLMDLPQTEREKFLQWNLDTLGAADFTSPNALKAWGEMDAYWRNIVKDRRNRGTKDLISQILDAQLEGENLADEEVSGFCSLLHDASQNTTMNMITNAVIVLSRHPDQRRKLKANPAMWSTALEELLRFVSPVQGLARMTTRDVELHGVTMKAGDQVLLLYGSANHDETMFDNPEVLDLERPVKTNWTFGHGIHYCLGNAVARLETRVAIQAMLDTIGDWELDESKLERNQLVPTRGVAHAPISFEMATV
ncbi:MAG: cytochrome P450 [Acidimicrobiales bacterium]